MTMFFSFDTGPIIVCCRVVMHSTVSWQYDRPKNEIDLIMDVRERFTAIDER